MDILTEILINLTVVRTMPEFDVDGSFPMGSSILLRGPPGVGKTELLLNLSRRWIRNGDKVLYVTVSAGGEEILSRFLSEFNRDQLDNRLLIIDCFRNNTTESKDKLIVNINGLSHLESITLAISTAVEALGAPVRVVFDGLSTLFLHNAPQTMAKFFQVLSVRSKNEFGFIVSSLVEGMHESVTTNTLMSIADGVIEIELGKSMARFVRLRFLKGRTTDPVWYRYRLHRNELQLAQHGLFINEDTVLDEIRIHKRNKTEEE
ncbi:MAG: RAD55 family ATPase [Thermoplasmata archaeon]|uniref:AAA family ATPase n=1 Tax=Candidatus Sysuiplasma superficiale TaxID=2823368 RepID=A0A8J7YW00_9ARCH|nr:AAA family ATPase [Candidatus Sysuiplasma superficiale]MBX8643431.1 RAD55 family ATPase [Candidatus Sysuiplasma superficiale]